MSISPFWLTGRRAHGKLADCLTERSGDEVSEQGADNFLAYLEASFGAAIARDEEDAASDLAFSLLQDLDLAQTLKRGGGASVRLPGGGSLPVSEVGLDYVVAGEGVVVPSAHAVIVQVQGGVPPAPTDRGLLGLLRSAARSGLRAQVTTAEGTFTGRVAKAGRGHLVLQIEGRETVVLSLEALRSMRFFSGG